MQYDDSAFFDREKIMRQLFVSITLCTVLLSLPALAQENPAPFTAVPAVVAAPPAAASPTSVATRPVDRAPEGHEIVGFKGPEPDSGWPTVEPETMRDALLAPLERGPARFSAGSFSAVFHGRLQFWGGWVGSDALLSEGDPMQEPGFRLRRARLGVEGGVTADITYRLELDVFDEEKTGGPLYEAWADYTPTHWLGVTVGYQKYPFARTQWSSSARIAHLDRAIGIQAIAPTHALGLSLHSEPWKDHLTVTAGIFNGLQRKSGFFQGFETVGVSEGNKFENLSFAGRLDLEPMDPIGPGEADLMALPTVRLSVGGGAYYNDGRSIGTLGATGHLHVKGYGAHLLGEVVYDRSKPRKSPTSSSTILETNERLVAQASLGYMILRDCLGLAVRGELLNDNMGRADEGDQVAIAATASWYALRDYVKLQLEYRHRMELHGPNLANDAVIAGVQISF